MTKKDEDALGVFERKILRDIFGGKKIDGIWYKRSNLELYHIFKEPDVIKFIKIQGIKWAGHLIRMKDSITRICLKLAAGCPRAGTQAARKMHGFVPIANSIEESKTEFCHWEKGYPLRQMKRAELVTPPRRAGSKGLFKTGTLEG
ncbi:hypothetical protein AVEN_53557-1 [Araneus ventricosus]|uniref:Uncharacterized protein n=1 Tax=Araneus ventricosus TaxID=182803 RepID=A0A4Y2VFK1_ARAVE|nr:hypothetical protein AVEN_53557-1 [Araneus ventricosus]